jgi:hypothetical protein
MNIRPVNLVVRGAVQSLMLIGQGKSLNLFTGVMEAKDVRPGSNTHSGQRRSEAEMAQDMGGISAQLETGPDLA